MPLRVWQPQYKGSNMSDVSIPLTGAGEKTFDFNGQKAIKSTVKVNVTDGSGGSGGFAGYPVGSEETKADGTVIVKAVKYRWACSPGIPDTWVPAGQFGGDPYYQNSYRVFVPGKPGGSIQITIEWQPYIDPPPPADLTPPPMDNYDIPLVIADNNIVIEPPVSPITETEWYNIKKILDEGLWVRVYDDYDIDELGHLVNQAPDVIDNLVSDEDDAERRGQHIIYESSRKHTGYIPSVFNPFLIPGMFMETSISSQYIYELMARIREIEVRLSNETEEVKYHFKEKAKEDE